MFKPAKLLQLLGIVVTGIGLVYGIMENDQGKEFTYLAIGILMFIAGTILDRKA